MWGDCLSSVSCSAQAIFEPYAAKRAWVSAKGVCLESVNKKPPQRNLSYTIAILELLPYSRTLGVPDSFYARFNIVSNKFHLVPCNLNSDKLFLTLSDQNSNPGGFSNPVPLVSTISWEIACRLRLLGHHGRLCFKFFESIIRENKSAEKTKKASSSIQVYL